MPFALFQDFKTFMIRVITKGEPTQKKIITVDVEAGLWNGLRVEDLNPTVTVHSVPVTVNSPSMTVHSPPGAVYSPKGFTVEVH
jgi:hypothetical protein